MANQILKINRCDYNCYGKRNKAESFRVYCKKVDKACKPTATEVEATVSYEKTKKYVKSSRPIAVKTDSRTFYDAIDWLGGDNFLYLSLVEKDKGKAPWSVNYDWINSQLISRDEVMEKIEDMIVLATDKLLKQAGLL